jgi:hypothetical protein
MEPKVISVGLVMVCGLVAAWAASVKLLGRALLSLRRNRMKELV